jgi:hypothetical protein
MPEAVVDQVAQREFAGRMVGIYTGAVLTKLIDLGTQVGLFEAVAAGPATCVGLARRAGLQERYVREWLGAMVAGGIFEYDPASGSYELPRERAELLSGSRRSRSGPKPSTPTPTITPGSSTSRESSCPRHHRETHRPGWQSVVAEHPGVNGQGFELEVFEERHHFHPPHRVEPEACRLTQSTVALIE